MTRDSQRRVIADHGTWAITVDPDPTRGKKEELTGIRKSNYWLFSGRNSSRLYQPDARNPFTQTLSEEGERAAFRRQLQAFVQIYNGHYAIQEFGDTVIVRGTYVSERRGRASLVVTSTPEKEIMYHLWLQDQDTFVSTDPPQHS